MTTMMVKYPKTKAAELKEMVEDGLHILGRAMTIAEQMCEEGEYGDRYGDRYPDMGEREPYMGERRGVRGTGRYSRF